VNPINLETVINEYVLRPFAEGIEFFFETVLGYHFPKEGCRAGSALEQRLCNEGPESNDRPDKYALLFSGSNGIHDMVTISRAYHSLQELGFDRDNIYILDEDGREEALCLDGLDRIIAQYRSDGIASPENLEKMFKHLSGKIDNKDTLLALVAGHGERIPVNLRSTNRRDRHCDEQKETCISTIVLADEKEINEITLKNYFDTIHPGTGILIFTGCYSGGIAGQFKKGGYIAVSASRADEPAHVSENDFAWEIVRALTDERADTNADGRISIKESFDLATSISYGDMYGDPPSIPQLFSEIDPSQIFLK